MDNDIKTWLYDILQSINEIDSYYDNKRSDKYSGNLFIGCKAGVIQVAKPAPQHAGNFIWA